MNREMELKIQAYLDGELSGREARRVAAWIKENPAAQALEAELKMTRAILKANEPELSLPESREFYWSKIERALQRLEQSGAMERLWQLVFAWRKYLVPLAGTAVLVLLALWLPRTDESLRQLAEVENLSEDTGSFSFRSHSENMFVVWVYEKPRSAEPEPDPMDEDDVTVQ